jgi:hypothetical protein
MNTSDYVTEQELSKSRSFLRYSWREANNIKSVARFFYSTYKMLPALRNHQSSFQVTMKSGRGLCSPWCTSEKREARTRRMLNT